MDEKICRRCGSILEHIKKCPICKKPNKFRCVKCNTTTEEQIHLDCKPSKIVDKITK